MLFCLGEGSNISKGVGYQKNNCIFNTQVTTDEWNKAKTSLPEIKIALTKWVDKKDMTDDDKEKYTVYKKIGGCLKRYEYKDAWATWWSEASKKDKQAILDLPHFNSEIFEGITGIKTPEKDDCSELTINGKKYKLVE